MILKTKEYRDLGWQIIKANIEIERAMDGFTRVVGGGSVEAVDADQLREARAAMIELNNLAMAILKETSDYASEPEMK